jgi:two-component system OmpR family response regulator
MAHILAVDDEPHIRDLVATILAAEGHNVELAADGHEALVAVQRLMPDLIVLDLAMPGMDGWRFLEELYVRGLRRRTRVVILSGQVEEYPPQDSLGSSRHFLEKPFDASGLITIVNDALDREPHEIVDRNERMDSLAKLIKKMEEVIP